MIGRMRAAPLGRVIVLFVQFVAGRFNRTIANAAATFMSDLIRFAVESPNLGQYTHADGSITDVLRTGAASSSPVFG